jgi:hypothetical protein
MLHRSYLFKINRARLPAAIMTMTIVLASIWRFMNILLMKKIA